jgi:hypothetical protein
MVDGSIALLGLMATLTVAVWGLLLTQVPNGAREQEVRTAGTGGLKKVA